MASDQKFPSLPESNWWALRKRIQSSPKMNLNARNLVSVFDAEGISMSEQSAKTNVLANLIRLGLVGEDGASKTELIDLWRSDTDYPEALQRIRSAIYPEDLLNIYPGKTDVIPALVSWFERNAGVGTKGARAMARTFSLLSDPDPKRSTSRGAGDPATRNSSSNPKKPRSNKAESSAPAASTESPSLDDVAIRPSIAKDQSNLPNLHIDVQIHISADSTDSQIESIFKNMSKYLYGSDNHD